VTAKTRVDLLVEAASLLLKVFPTLKAIIVGGGELDPLKLLAQKLGVEKNVIFTGPLYGEDALAPYFLSARLFVYPSAIGLSLMHAMGYGLPVITDDDIPNHNPEIDALNNNVNGLLYETGNAASLAKQIASLLRDDPRHIQMSKNALKTVTENYSLDNNVSGYVDAVLANSPK